mmetsp:Transcript_162490/g.520847  ORF Transcript_162490/g.520847 Transcript_162490/m.520847 type:complete len:215 (+) Transcript_162490:334-978(+)
MNRHVYDSCLHTLRGLDGRKYPGVRDLRTQQYRDLVARAEPKDAVLQKHTRPPALRALRGETDVAAKGPREDEHGEDQLQDHQASHAGPPQSPGRREVTLEALAGIDGRAEEGDHLQVGGHVRGCDGCRLEHTPHERMCLWVAAEGQQHIYLDENHHHLQQGQQPEVPIDRPAPPTRFETKLLSAAVRPDAHGRNYQAGHRQEERCSSGIHWAR